MNLDLASRFHEDDLTFNGRLFTASSLSHPLLKACRSSPQKLDDHLRPCLFHPDLPESLESLVKDYVSTLTTPALYGGGIRSRPRWFYANCAVFGMLLGRAYTLLSTPTRPPKSIHRPEDFPFGSLPAELRLQIYGYYKDNMAMRQKYWTAISNIFVKALWSGREPEEGARYMAGIIILTAGHAMSITIPMLRGRGTKYLWWDDTIKDPDRTWTFNNLQDAILSTSSLPRHNNDALKLQERWEAEFANPEHYEPSPTWMHAQEYVSREVLDVFDLAREHLLNDERDWTAPEIEARLMDRLFESDEARKIWVETGLVPRAFERRFAMERTLIRNEET